MRRIKKSDQVIVITGRDRGKIGKVLRMYASEDRIIVEKVNLVKRHTKPSNKNPQGGIVEKEAKIHISNVMLLDSKTGKGTRVGFKTLSDGKKVRYSKKSNETIEAK